LNSPDESQDATTKAGQDAAVASEGSAQDVIPSTPAVLPEIESSGDAALDARLAEPVLQGYRGIETAQLVMSTFLVIVVGVIAYSNSLGGDFVALDRYLVLENEALHRLASLPEASLPGGPGPLATAMLALNWTLTPASASGFQAANVLIHLLNALLLYLVARTLLRSRTSEAVCMTAGLLLAVLPIATESVNYFVARGALMATSFSLLALLFAHRATAPERVRSAAMAASILCHVAAAACAAPAIILPVVTLAYLWMVTGAEGWKRWSGWAGGLLVLQAALVVVFYALVDVVPGRVSALPSFMVQALVEAAVPVGLSIGHGLPYFSYFVMFFVVLLSGSFILALLVLRRRVGVPLLWFVVFAAATATTTPPGAMLAGHYFYLPLTGLLLLAPWALTRLPKGAARVGGGAAIAAAVLAMGWITLQRNELWRDPIGLWNEAAARYPDAFEPKHELGRLYVQEGEALLAVAARDATATGEGARAEASKLFTAASELLDRSVVLGDPHIEVSLYLAQAHMRLGHEDEGYHALLDALARDSTHYDATLQLASLLESRVSDKNDRADAVAAIAYYERARSLKAMTPERLARLGMLMASVGRFEEAAEVLREAVGGNETSPFGEALRSVEARVNELQTLDQSSATLMQRNPADPQGLRARAQAQLIRGKYLDASYVLERGLKQYPGDYGTWLFLGLARAKLDAAEQFVSAHGQAPAGADAGVSPWRDLAERAAGMGSFAAGRTYLAQDAVSSELDKALALASWALAQRNIEEARAAIGQATASAAADPRPWLYAVDLALLEGSIGDAEQAIAEAKRLGAEAKAVEERAAQIERARSAAASQAPAEPGA